MLCNRVEDYFGGPFWDFDAGDFLYRDLILSDLRVEDSLPSLSDEERMEFLGFAKGILRWLLDDRKSAKELLEHSWLAPE
jgi:serine/threonine-protein kinase SRPK3